MTKKRALVALIIIETSLLVLLLLLLGSTLGRSDGDLSAVSYVTEGEELLREESPCGGFTLLVEESAPPDFPFGADHLRVTLFEMVPEEEQPRAYYRASFEAEVLNDGAQASFEVKWFEEGVQIALIGSEQPTAYYILPFGDVSKAA